MSDENLDQMTDQELKDWAEELKERKAYFAETRCPRGVERCEGEIAEIEELLKSRQQ